jgi:protein-S-isoprenylcysteine O-methyltransferase Ste14
MLLGLFAVQHSAMARPGFKRWWTRLVPRSVERSTYVLFASVVLLILYWQWRPLVDPVWTARAPIAVAILHVIFWFGWGMLLVSTCLISHFELFGLKQVFARLLGSAPSAAKFHTPLFYRHVRHPIYLSFLLAFWATPTMTTGHLLFSLASTGYILIAIQLEERDLIGLFGEQYRRYRQSVAMLVPLPGRRLLTRPVAQASSVERNPH